jgi:glucan-binding YG repeat protein
MKKGFDLRKLMRYTIPIIALLLIVSTVIIFRSSLIPGWYGKGEERFYLSYPFTRASGITTIGGKDYIFSDYGDHSLIYGWCKVDGVRYYTDDNGAIVKGDAVIDGENYWFETNTGALYADEMRIYQGKLWYFNDHGIKTFGLVFIDGLGYCFNETGNLKKGLQVIDGKTYYFRTEDGHDKETMVVNEFISVDGDEYYFGSDGAALIGEHEIDGKTYVFDESGKLI